MAKAKIDSRFPKTYGPEVTTWNKWEGDCGARWTSTGVPGVTTESCHFSSAICREKGPHNCRIVGETKDRNEASEWFRRPEELANRDQVMTAWSAAETRIGKFVNLDTDTLNSLIGCPLNMLTDSVRSILSGK